MEKVVIAFGGNALLRNGEQRSYEVQYNHAKEAFRSISKIISENRVILTHGNGPQVGDILLSHEISGIKAYLHECVAMSQGTIGEILSNAYNDIKNEYGMQKQIVQIITRVAVNKNDPAFSNPTKPIGRSYKEEEVAAFESKGWIMKNTDEGWRRVVPSPKPIRIVEIEAIENLANAGFLPIAVGGGGIPVIEENKSITPVDAVIDKDFASSLLAIDIKADTLMILTDVDYAYIDFEKPSQKKIKEASLSLMENYINNGEFESGSMLPKVQAAMEFVKNGGKRAIITSLENASKAFYGNFGTIIRPD
ncbi:MAG: carbamate kinase [Candidatus Micrarchaeia archaeon]